MVFSDELWSDEFFKNTLAELDIRITRGLDNQTFDHRQEGASLESQGKTDTEAVGIYASWAVTEEFSHIIELVSFELSREPGYDFDRAIERNVAARALVFTWIKRFSEESPDLCLFPEAPHNAWNLSAMLVGEKMDVEHLWFQAADPLAPIVFPRNRKGFIKELRPSLSEEFRDVSSICLETLDDSLKKLADEEKPANAVELESRLSSASHKIKKYLRILTPRPKRVLDPMPRLRLGYNLYEKILFSMTNRVIRRRFLLGQPKNSLIDKELNFVFFPLHYQPEKSSIPEGPLIPFQADLVALVRSITPADNVLVVKEHPHQIIRQDGHYGRSPSVYPFLASIPGVTLAPTMQDSRALIEASNAVVTITGSVGLEAALSGKPVLHLGDPWWKGLPGTKAMGDIDKDYRLQRIKVPAANELSHWIYNFAKQFGFPGFATNSRKIFWSDRLSEEKISAISNIEIDGIIRSIEKMLILK